MKQQDKMKSNISLHLPNDDDGEIEQIPAVSEIGARVHDEPVRYNLHNALRRKYY